MEKINLIKRQTGRLFNNNGSGFLIGLLVGSSVSFFISSHYAGYSMEKILTTEFSSVRDKARNGDDRADRIMKVIDANGRDVFEYKLILDAIKSSQRHMDLDLKK